MIGDWPPGADLSAMAASAPDLVPSGVVRAVFFDAGDTLLRPRRPFDALLQEVGHCLGIDLSPALLDGIARRVDQRVMARTRQGRPFTFPAQASQQFWYETYHGYFRDYLPGHHAVRLAESLLAELSSPGGYVLFDETIDTLARLRRHGYHLGIISNWEAWLPDLLEASGLARYVDTLVISGICQIEKPDPRIFTLALEEAGFMPGEVVYVGDRPAHDVIPVQQVGITPILLDRDNRYPQYDGLQRMTSLDQIHTALNLRPVGGR